MKLTPIPWESHRNPTGIPWPAGFPKKCQTLPQTLRPKEGWISTVKGPGCWVFSHSPFNVYVATGVCEWFITTDLLETSGTVFFPSCSIHDEASGIAAMIYNVLYCQEYKLFLSFIVLMLSMPCTIKWKLISPLAKHNTGSLTNVLYNPAHQAKPKCWVRKTCFVQTLPPPFAFSAYSYTLSACSIYPRHGPSPHRQEDAGLWLLISLISCCAWLILLTHSKLRLW